MTVPPRITQPPEDVSVAEGEEVYLECEATGDPQPSLTWRREDRQTFNHTQGETCGPRRVLICEHVLKTVLQISGTF